MGISLFSWRLFAALLLATARGSLAAPGDLDSTFGGGLTQVDLASAEDKPEAMTTASDGSIFLDGSTFVGLGREFVVAKFTATGQLDPSFGGDGIVHTPIGDDAVAYGSPSRATARWSSSARPARSTPPTSRWSATPPTARPIRCSAAATAW